ncbi:hypothetical protein RO787_21055 [Blautia coccoides]|uniref:hypothetical protein n=1 Tax=Blautia producta TaxID=33035 RepID=UPI0028A39AB3|nr:hypothetical protein [Blautia coccoides]MDT4375822.1 hypothetical protein [Blautia coccoides]
MIKIERFTLESLSLLNQTREYLMSLRDTAPEHIQIGINYNIILNSAMIFEGEMEQLLHSIVTRYEEIYVRDMGHGEIKENLVLSKSFRSFVNGIFKNTMQQISKNTGYNNYKNMLIQLIDDYVIPAEMKQFEEGIVTLFEFRNVLAHGRSLNFEIKTHLPYPTYHVENVEEDFRGGYKRTEEYLLKKKLINQKIIESENFYSILTNDVCNHFVEVQKRYLQECKKSIPTEFNVV